MTIDDVKLIQLPKFTDPRGNLSYVEQLNHIPFEIKRTYWIYDVPEERTVVVMLSKRIKSSLWHYRVLLMLLLMMESIRKLSL